LQDGGTGCAANLEDLFHCSPTHGHAHQILAFADEVSASAKTPAATEAASRGQPEPGEEVRRSEPRRRWATGNLEQLDELRGQRILTLRRLTRPSQRCTHGVERCRPSSAAPTTTLLRDFGRAGHEGPRRCTDASTTCTSSTSTTTTTARRQVATRQRGAQPTDRFGVRAGFLHRVEHEHDAGHLLRRIAALGDA
jgi:hypothetical protein